MVNLKDDKAIGHPFTAYFYTYAKADFKADTLFDEAKNRLNAMDEVNANNNKNSNNNNNNNNYHGKGKGKEL